MQNDNLPAVLTVEEAALFLRVGRTSAYEAVRTGQIPSVKVGRQYRILRAALLDWLGQNGTALGGNLGAASEVKEGTCARTTFRRL